MSLHVGEVTVSRSPGRGDRTRAAVDVRIGNSPSEEIWIDVPARHAPELHRGPDPWLLLLLPMAAVSGRTLVLPGPVDSRLLANARELLRIWDAWYPWTEPVRLDVPEGSPSPPSAGGRTGAFFSGGVDSFFTILRHAEGTVDPDRRESPDDLLTVCGFDIPVRREAACQRVFGTTAAVAEALGMEPVTLNTNLRASSWDDRVPWADLGFGAALAACAHLLGGRSRRALIPAGSGYYRMGPHGCHPLTTPLMSSDCLELVHDGAAATRVEKTRRVARSELARSHLRVCWRSGTDRNCSRCEKCYRTMLTLDLLGELDRFGTFERDRFRVDRVRHILARKESDAIFLEQIADLARERGARAAEERVRQALARSRGKRLLLRIADRLDDMRGLWRLGRRLRRWVMDRSIV